MCLTFFSSTVCIPGVWGRSRNCPESWQRARSRSRGRPNCLDSDSETFCFNLWYSLPMQGRIWMHFLEIICADIVFELCRYQERGQRPCVMHPSWKIRRASYTWPVAESHGLQRRILGGKRGHAPQSARKWHKIDTFLDITRKSNFYSYKSGLYYLLDRKQAKSDYFSDIRVPISLTSLWSAAPPKALSLAVAVLGLNRRWGNLRELLRHIKKLTWVTKKKTFAAKLTDTIRLKVWLGFSPCIQSSFISDVI